MELKLRDTKEEKKDDNILLPGFRFHPTDEELVGFYLKRKVEMKPIKIDIIKNIDVYKYEPWDLPKEMNNKGGEKEREWYFFCRRGRKYKNSIRPNRVTGCGFWKATGIDKPIYSAGSQFHDHHSSVIIGLKKSLVYYRGTSGKGTKTDWMMHEFRLPAPTSSHNPNTADFQQEAEVWTLCRIFKREVLQKKYASDWRKFSSKQAFNDSTASKIYFSESDDGFKYEKFEVSADNNKTESKHNVAVAANNNNFCQSNNQLSLATQVPFIANRDNNEVASCEDGTWDELRPMVEYALYPSIMYSFR